MSVKDRDALARIVKGRFEVLRGEYDTRVYAIRGQVAQEVRDEFAEKIKQYQDSVKELESDGRKLEERGRALLREARKNGLSPRYNSEPISVKVEYKVEIANVTTLIEERVNDMFNGLPRDGGLRERELSVLENLIVGSLDSDEAKEFMDSIPTVDDLLPPLTAGTTKQITGG